jgi:bifunctional NMN adenylyltransferase/nudix hydrolase
MKHVAVLHAPFQTPTVPLLHQKILSEIFGNFSDVVIALPQKRVAPTKNNPLSFPAREAMIREYTKALGRYVYIVQVVDKKYGKDQVAALETPIKALFTEPFNAYLYTDLEFAGLYTENGGKWNTNYRSHFLSAEKTEREATMMKLDYASEDFRRGMIFAMNSQFPISWGTVDMAIRREVVCDREAPPHTKVLYLFGKKPGELGWRFPGGFKDVTDPDYETAVWREGGEEVLKQVDGKPIVEPSTVFTKPIYIASRRVNDWRYRGEKDAITTLFYQIEYTGHENFISASDDLADTKWFDLSELNREDVEGEHKFLYDELVAFEARQSKTMRCQKCDTVLTCDCGICPPIAVAK